MYPLSSRSLQQHARSITKSKFAFDLRSSRLVKKYLATVRTIGVPFPTNLSTPYYVKVP